LKCSLQDIYLAFEIEGGQGTEKHQNGFAITGLTLEGASWEQGEGLQLSSSIRCPISVGYLNWVSKQNDDLTVTLFFLNILTSGNMPYIQYFLGLQVKTSERMSTEEFDNLTSLPVYLNDSRITLVCQMEMSRPQGVPDFVWAQRGVAFIAWTSTL